MLARCLLPTEECGKEAISSSFVGAPLLPTGTNSYSAETAGQGMLHTIRPVRGTSSPALLTQGAPHAPPAISRTYLQVLPPLRFPFQECIQHRAARFAVRCIIPAHNIVRCSNPLEELRIGVLPTAVVGDVCQVHVDRWPHRHRQTAFRTIGSFGKKKTEAIETLLERKTTQMNSEGLEFQAGSSLQLQQHSSESPRPCCSEVTWVHFWASAVAALGREGACCCSLGRDWMALGSETFPGEGNKIIKKTPKPSIISFHRVVIPVDI